MPICLNCGKEIKRGERFCGDCRRVDGASELSELALERATSNYTPRRRRFSTGWIVGLTVVLIGLAAALAFGLLSMMPTNEKFQVQTQARVCRNNLTRLQTIVKGYTESTQQYPPPGRIGKNHPLIKDGYLDAPSLCPTTGHEYVLVVKDGVATPTCDSKLEGHSLAPRKDTAPETPSTAPASPGQTAPVTPPPPSAPPAVNPHPGTMPGPRGPVP